MAAILKCLRKALGSLLLLALFAFEGCTGSQRQSQADAPYFRFDRVEHYALLNGADSLLYALAGKEERKTDEEAWLVEVLSGDAPSTLWGGRKFARRLLQAGYVRHEVPPRQFAAIDSLFSDHGQEVLLTTACVPIYRDVLLFKRGRSLVGIAKICFECSQHHIVGAAGNTEGFGQSGDYEKLHKLLHPDAGT